MRAKTSGKVVSGSRTMKWRRWFQNHDAAVAPSHADLIFVLDSNIWISAILFGGDAERVVQFARTEVKLISSDYITDEVVSFLRLYRPKLPHKFVVAVRHGMGEFAVPVRSEELAGVVRDVNDEPIVRLALDYGAVIVTGDKDILESDAAPAMTLREFMELFELKN